MVALLSAKKGQAVVLDLIAGLFIFLVLFSYFIVFWGIFSERYVGHARQEGLETRAISVAESLVSGPGHPFNWTADPSSAQSIGIASLPNRLDGARISALESLSYADAKHALGIGTEFYIRIDGQNGTIIYSEAGQQPQNTSSRVEVSRLAILEGQIVDVRVQVYEN